MKALTPAEIVFVKAAALAALPQMLRTYSHSAPRAIAAEAVKQSFQLMEELKDNGVTFPPLDE
jgi:hypothetical protein